MKCHLAFRWNHLSIHLCQEALNAPWQNLNSSRQNFKLFLVSTQNIMIDVPVVMEHIYIVISSRLSDLQDHVFARCRMVHLLASCIKTRPFWTDFVWESCVFGVPFYVYEVWNENTVSFPSNQQKGKKKIWKFVLKRSDFDIERSESHVKNPYLWYKDCQNFHHKWPETRVATCERVLLCWNACCNLAEYHDRCTCSYGTLVCCGIQLYIILRLIFVKEQWKTF